MEIPFSALATLVGVEYCVIGTGPAGITCARELAARGRRVLLLEGGDREASAESQSLYEGETEGDKYFQLDSARLRFFGGTSNHWAGWVRPLEDFDFAGKGPSRIGRWPIARSDIDPYLAKAAEILEFTPPPPDRALPGGELRQIAMAFSPPVRFNAKYFDAVVADPNIFLCLNCNLTAINADDGTIRSITVLNYEGASAEIGATTFILACGGIENSRLLLWSDIRSDGRLLQGRADMVGRYWFEHHHARVADAIVATDAVPESTNPSPRREAESNFYALTREHIAAHNVLGCSVRLFPSPREDLSRLFEDIACVAPNWANWAYDQVVNGTLCARRVHVTAEQEPRYENRVALDATRDRFGIPRVRLHWQRSDLDLATMRAAAEAYGRYMAATDQGRVRLAPWVLSLAPYPNDVEIAGYHHMGGTRMGEDPTTGVVDRNCRLFGIDNLYVMGSSVFPGGGHATPTVTITQLSLRLVAHLTGSTPVNAVTGADSLAPVLAQ